MNPFSKETLTQHQLKNNCLCLMTPEKQQIKSSMQFLGRIHENYVKALNAHFNEDKHNYLALNLNNKLISTILSNQNSVFLSDRIDTDFEANTDLLNNFVSYDTAYYQLIYEISNKVITAINLILDDNNALRDIYISGGFNRNEIFIKFLSVIKPSVTVRVPDVKNETALGAALLMKDYLKQAQFLTTLL
jgi:hypothetical protein